MGNGFAHHFTKSIFCQFVHASSHHNVIVYLSSKNRKTSNFTNSRLVCGSYTSIVWVGPVYLDIDDVMGVILIVGFGTT